MQPQTAESEPPRHQPWPGPYWWSFELGCWMPESLQERIRQDQQSQRNHQTLEATAAGNFGMYGFWFGKLK